MCLNCSKIKAYIGFAKKARKIIFGIDDIEKQIKNCEIIIYSDVLSSRSEESLLNTANKYKVNIYKLNENEFDNNLDSICIKAIAITDKNLSDAIKKELD